MWPKDPFFPHFSYFHISSAYFFLILNKIPFVQESMVWGAADEDGEGADGANDTTISATVTLDLEEVAEALGEEYDDQQVEALLWGEIDAVNDTLPLYKKIKKLHIRKEDFEKTTGKKIKRFVESNKAQ